VNAPVWRVEDDGEVMLPGSATTAEAGLVSLPFLVAAVRRKWRLVAATAGVCAFLALGLLQMGAGQHTASVTLLLISDPNADPTAAMATNETLVHTRSVASEVVDSLGLALSPEDFQATVNATPMSNQLMAVTVSAPTDAEAITRINALTKVYLDFRAQQLSSATNTAIKANNKHIDDLTTQIDDLTKNYLAALGTPGQQSLADSLLSQRSQLQSQLYDAQLANAQAQVQNQGIVDASHVVDDAAIVHKSRLKKAVFAVASGLIGGTALGLVLVLAPAILSTRLRRRDDVARALGLPVRFSAGPVAGRWWWLPGRGVRRNAERLAHGLATALPEDDEPARLTLATVGDVREGAYVVGALADELARESTSVAVIDLSASGVLARPPRRLFGRADPIQNRQLVRVHRHDVRVSELASRTRTRFGSDKELEKAEVILTLIELDLGAGVDALGELADVSVVLVSAGRVSAERLRSSATLLRQSDISPAFAMLVGVDDMDDSSGLLESSERRDASARRSS
jgi:capsular polysaccharide biosynthesis protein